LTKNAELSLLLSGAKKQNMNGKGWFIAMAITIALVWWGANYLFPWQH
jgi:hypothetical protein